MGSAANSGIVLIAPKLLAVALIFVIIVCVFMFVVRHQDDLEADLVDTRDEIVKCRKNRYTLMGQAITMFGNGNPDVKNLTTLRDIYSKSDSEEREIMWEKKYVVVMRRFMEYAGEHCRPEMKSAYDMLNTAVEENEANLSAARDGYENAKRQASAYAKPPLSYIAAAGDKAAGFLRRQHEMKQEWDQQSDQEENDDVQGQD